MRKLRVLIVLLAVLLLSSAGAETFTLSMVGDCTVGDQWKYHGYKSSFTYKIKQSGLDYPFSLAAELFAADDLTLANCEGVLTDRNPPKNHKFMTLGAPTAFGEVFKLGHVDVCNLANNHGMDFGKKGRADTLATLEALGIRAFGESSLTTFEAKGVKIGFVGYSYPINDGKMKKYRKALDQLRAEGCTFCIASAHWGKEESLNIDATQRRFAPELIDMGFDMVYGTGSHTVQPMQVYNGKLIFYGLSNFTFGANAAPKDDDSVVVQVVFDILPDGGMQARTVQAIPYKMHKDRDFRPYPIEDQQGKEQVWKKMVFTRKKDPVSGLPDSFLTTGFADLMILEDVP